MEDSRGVLWCAMAQFVREHLDADDAGVANRVERVGERFERERTGAGWQPVASPFDDRVTADGGRAVAYMRERDLVCRKNVHGKVGRLQEIREIG